MLRAEQAHAQGRARSQRRWMLLAWAAVAGAVLSKGLVGLLIPGASLALASLWRRDAAIWRRMHWHLVHAALAAAEQTQLMIAARGRMRPTPEQPFLARQTIAIGAR